MLVIVNKPLKRSPFSKETYKSLLRDITKRKRGPDGVIQSLLRGLDEIKYPYKINPSLEEIKDDDTVWVNSSLDALEFILKIKTENQILLAGPNLVVTPLEHQGILANKKIDGIIEPSLWVKDFIASLNPTLEAKILIWPAGVSIPEVASIQKNLDVLIYNKNPDEKDFVRTIQTRLTRDRKSFEVLTYGAFEQQDYFEKVARAKSLIYIGKSESQGLALQEAWARGTPTLVLEQSHFNYRGYSFKAEKVSAPYLNEQSGMFFKKEEFDKKFSEFFEKINEYSPYTYVKENLSDKVCAEKFLVIINRFKN